MSASKTPSKVRRAYKFIEAHSDEYSISAMCRVLGVARAGYYAWLSNPISDRTQEDVRLLRLIRASFSASMASTALPASCKTCESAERRAVSIKWRDS